MKRVFGFEQLKFERRLAREFGSGHPNDENSLFSLLNAHPDRFERRSAHELLQRVSDFGRVVVFFDRTPDNLWCAMTYLDPSLHQYVVAHELNAEELAPLLECGHCDLYILSTGGDLMAIATHEDPEEDGLRQVNVVAHDSCKG